MVDNSNFERELEDLQSQKTAADTRLEQARGVLKVRIRRGQEELARLTAAPPQSSQLAAEGDVATAREMLRKAEAEYIRVTAPPPSADVAVAEQAIVVAQANLKKTEADLARLRQGPNISDVRKAQNDLAAAESAHAKAVEAFRVLVSGPDPFALRAAERGVAEAQIQLQTVRQTPPPPPVYSRTEDSKADREARRRTEREAANAQVAHVAEIQKAESALRAALDQLEKVRTQPPRAEIDSAVRAVESAERSVLDARERLATVQEGARPEEIALAEAAVGSAQATVERARANLEILQSGPSAGEIASARAGVLSARSGVEVALARQQELLASSNADSVDVQATQERIALLEHLLELSLPDLDALIAVVDPKERELLDAIGLYRDALRGLAEVDGRLGEAENQRTSLRLVAPFAGVITRVVTPAGETTQANKPVLFLARADAPVIHADVGQREGQRLAVGQHGTLELPERTGPPLGVTLADVADGEAGRRVTLEVAWGDVAPTLGQPVQATVVVQERERALLVPRRAIINVGGRRYLDVYDRTPPRRVPVEVGLSSDDDVEVTGDIREGQAILVAP